MVRTNKLTAIAVSCLLFLLSFSCVQIPAFAASQEIDVNRRGSISISMKDNESGQNIPVEFVVYKVADLVVTQDGVKYTLCEDFVNSGIQLDDIEADGLAGQFNDYIEKNDIAPYKKGSQTSSGTIFNDLPLGLYLVVQDGEVEGYFPVSPFLVSVPIRNSDGTLVYDVNADSKSEIWKLTDVSVEKVWNTREPNEKLPDKVTVQLLRGDKVVATVSLSDANGWQYTWKDLPLSDEYSIKEINIPKGFTATYTSNGLKFVVTNTSKLPHTGQLYWPIPVLCIGGLLIMMLGWAILHSDKKEYEKTNRN